MEILSLAAPDRLSAVPVFFRVSSTYGPLCRARVRAMLSEQWLVTMRQGWDMNGARDADAAVQVVTARLPSGAPVQVEVTVPAGGDELTSVGLRDLDLDHALDTIAEIGTVVVDRLKAAKPTKATVELKL